MSLNYSVFSVNISAYNEAERIGSTVANIKKYFPNVFVVDDGSQDNTKLIAEENGAKVIDNEYEKGYLGATKTGFKNAKTEWIITVDADGEHRMEDIIGISKYAKSNDYDLVMGARKISQISRLSELFLSLTASMKSPVFDTGTGLRAIKTELARKMKLYGKCVCGTFVIEAIKLGAKVGEYPIRLHTINKPRSVAWKHFAQFFILLYQLLRNKKSNYGN